jgi:D-alanyl-D-alanine carboxypeptidase
VVRGGVHLIGIVMGGRTAVRRDLEMMHLLDTAFAQIDTNPALVARGSVPWAAVADAGQQPAVAGFTLPRQGVPTAGQLVALSQVPPPIPNTDDEDAAEARRAPDENFSTLQAQAPQLASVAAPPKPAPVTAIPPATAQAASAPIPVARPADTAVASATPSPAIHSRTATNDAAKPVTVAALPKMRPAQHTDHCWRHCHKGRWHSRHCRSHRCHNHHCHNHRSVRWRRPTLRLPLPPISERSKPLSRIFSSGAPPFRARLRL